MLEASSLYSEPTRQPDRHYFRVFYPSKCSSDIAYRWGYIYRSKSSYSPVYNNVWCVKKVEDEEEDDE
jgi:hypothetical protein